MVTGNDAAGQLQLGVFGDLFSIVALHVENGNVVDTETGRLLAQVADLTCDRWQRKDSGMWELPGDDSRWRSEAARIRGWVEENCWSEDRGAYVWYPVTDHGPGQRRDHPLRSRLTLRASFIAIKPGALWR